MIQKIIFWSICKFISLYFQTLRVQCIINNHIFFLKAKTFPNTSHSEFHWKILLFGLFLNAQWPLWTNLHSLIIVDYNYYVLMADSLQSDTLPTEEKHRIVALTHKLLTKVCCSHTHGINFHDKTLGTSGKYAFLLRNNCWLMT